VTDPTTLADVTARGEEYLRIADRLLPGWITDFYVVGSAALDEYRPGRSDLDFIAIVDGGLDGGGLARLRAVHLLAAADALRRSVRRGMPNGAFVRDEDRESPVTAIRPVASHVAATFHRGRGFDVNPVMWKVLADRGIRIRGRAPSELGLDVEPDRLRAWNLANLESYWRPWGERVVQRGPLPLRPAWTVAWGVLGVPRLHCTIATGEVIGKRSAADYAAATFGPEWHAIIDLARRWWEGSLTAPVTAADARRAGEFVLAVVASAGPTS